METIKEKKFWLENIFIIIIILLVGVSFISNFLNILSEDNSNSTYLLMFFYILPIIFIIGLIKRKIWSYGVLGVWCCISAIFILFTILFTPLGKSIWIFVGQFILTIILSIGSFYLSKKIIKSNQNIQEQISQDPNVTSLRQYITNSRRQGYSDEQIRIAIQKKGWSEGYINEAFRY